MTYATRQDLDSINGADEVDLRLSILPDGELDRILENADAVINGYLVGRYTLPLSPVPAELPQRAAAIARYSLLGESATERARNDFKDAMAWLKDVAQGVVLLQSAAVLPGSEPATVVMAETSPSVFNRKVRP